MYLVVFLCTYDFSGHFDSKVSRLYNDGEASYATYSFSGRLVAKERPFFWFQSMAVSALHVMFLPVYGCMPSATLLVRCVHVLLACFSAVLRQHSQDFDVGST